VGRGRRRESFENPTRGLVGSRGEAAGGMGVWGLFLASSSLQPPGVWGQSLRLPEAMGVEENLQF